MSTSTERWNYERYAAIPADGLRHEVMGGAHYVNAAPNLYHQSLSGRLQFQLFAMIERRNLGFVFAAPCDVELGEHDIVQPDLIVVTSSRQDILTPTRILGVPDLIIEILSPSSVSYDRVQKKAVYQQYQVPEYWIVDGDSRTVDQLVLVDGAYRSQSHTQSIRMNVPPHATVDLTQVW